MLDHLKLNIFTYECALLMLTNIKKWDQSERIHIAREFYEFYRSAIDAIELRTPLIVFFSIDPAIKAETDTPTVRARHNRRA